MAVISDELDSVSLINLFSPCPKGQAQLCLPAVALAQTWFPQAHLPVWWGCDPSTAASGRLAGSWPGVSAEAGWRSRAAMGSPFGGQSWGTGRSLTSWFPLQSHRLNNKMWMKSGVQWKFRELSSVLVPKPVYYWNWFTWGELLEAAGLQHMGQRPGDKQPLVLCLFYSCQAPGSELKYPRATWVGGHSWNPIYSVLPLPVMILIRNSTIECWFPPPHPSGFTFIHMPCSPFTFPMASPRRLLVLVSWQCKGQQWKDLWLWGFFCPEAEEECCSRLSVHGELGCFEKLFLILDWLGMDLVILCYDLSLERRDAAMCG